VIDEEFMTKMVDFNSAGMALN